VRGLGRVIHSCHKRVLEIVATAYRKIDEARNASFRGKDIERKSPKKRRPPFVRCRIIEAWMPAGETGTLWQPSLWVDPNVSKTGAGAKLHHAAIASSVPYFLLLPATRIFNLNGYRLNPECPVTKDFYPMSEKPRALRNTPIAAESIIDIEQE